MALSLTSIRLLMLATLGVIVFGVTYTQLSATAGAFFGFVYILAIPLVYELLKRGPRFVGGGPA